MSPVDESTVDVVARNDETKAVRTRFKAGANVEAATDIGWTPLAVAAFTKLFYAAVTLLTCDADAHRRINNDNRRLPHVVAKHGGCQACEGLSSRRRENYRQL